MKYNVREKYHKVTKVSANEKVSSIKYESNDYIVSLWDIQTGKNINTFTGHKSASYDVEYSFVNINVKIQFKITYGWCLLYDNYYYQCCDFLERKCLLLTFFIIFKYLFQLDFVLLLHFFKKEKKKKLKNEGNYVETKEYKVICSTLILGHEEQETLDKICKEIKKISEKKIQLGKEKKKIEDNVQISKIELKKNLIK
ncbi:hypothetical protein RFI_38263 [Reticulomyxa filosa]|uniref:Uncharacterized protein n=1 Tax=Reticulomyxa filosa TaxID=46433 RepID=X6LCE1_RETFI|nr:hypothetical protein RFI_38263 [Reticulomyxa filosa]|eukprot:ETN99218.1 hypothetical protein RFI_38263 [Reticulomyxa filosa]